MQAIDSCFTLLNMIAELRRFILRICSRGERGFRAHLHRLGNFWILDHACEPCGAVHYEAHNQTCVPGRYGAGVGAL